MSRTLRRIVSTLCGTAALAMALGTLPAQAQTPIKFTLDWVFQGPTSPFLVALEKTGDAYAAGRFVRASRLARYQDVENGEWKFLVFDAKSGEPRMPRGAIGFRWQQQRHPWRMRSMKPSCPGRPTWYTTSLLRFSTRALRMRAAISSSTSSQVTRSHSPHPRAPLRFIG